MMSLPVDCEKIGVCVNDTEPPPRAAVETQLKHAVVVEKSSKHDRVAHLIHRTRDDYNWGVYRRTWCVFILKMMILC